MPLAIPSDKLQLAAAALAFAISAVRNLVDALDFQGVPDAPKPPWVLVVASFLGLLALVGAFNGVEALDFGAWGHHLTMSLVFFLLAKAQAEAAGLTREPALLLGLGACVPFAILAAMFIPDVRLPPCALVSLACGLASLLPAVMALMHAKEGLRDAGDDDAVDEADRATTRLGWFCFVGFFFFIMAAPARQCAATSWRARWAPTMASGYEVLAVAFANGLP
jgi:hypothetical protein